jgi:hypothetical protein
LISGSFSPLGDAQQVRPHRGALKTIDCVAAHTARTKELLPIGDLVQLLCLPACEPIANLIGKHIGVYKRRALHPPACGLIANDHVHIVVVRAVLDVLDV